MYVCVGGGGCTCARAFVCMYVTCVRMCGGVHVGVCVCVCVCDMCLCDIYTSHVYPFSRKPGRCTVVS